MNNYNINVEKVSLIEENGQKIEANLFSPEKIELKEDECNSFFSYLDEKSVEIISWPIYVNEFLTEEDEVYNEELLALLRKIFIEKANFKSKVLLKPVYENLDSSVVIACLKHVARRLKKMECIIGLIFPSNSEFKKEKVRQEFIDELSKKHEHYKFYSLAKN